VADIAIRWTEGLVFEGGPAGRPAIRVDAHSRTAASPVELLQIAAATCSAADVVLILEKQRLALRGLTVLVQATRRDTEPRRITALHLRFTLTSGPEGPVVDEARARRAIELSIEKYCSVIASLAPDTGVTYDVALA
jgi:putative redox protein